jgi:hypothetical protein
MMDMTLVYLITALTTLVAITLVSFVGLKGFTAWIDFKRAELQNDVSAAPPSTSSRIEIADLKERLRKLEAIAAGVDL